VEAELDAMRTIPRGKRPARTVDRFAAAFLLVLMGVGSLVLWIGIPAASLWGLSKVTESGTRHFLLSLIVIPAAMVLFAPALFWLNDLYLRVVGAFGDDDEDEAERRRSLHGPLRLFLYASMVIALVALFAWIFFVAENPPYTVW
jgi:hypothetical protein